MANIAVQRIKRELKEVLNSDEVIMTFKIQLIAIYGLTINIITHSMSGRSQGVLSMSN
jgi:hypothetical protein